MKFTEAGYVRLRVTMTNSRPQTSPVRLRFVVEDSGIGITPEQLASLFQPFSQADGSITRKYGGTGLGLAISERIVQQMGGAFEVASAYGTGSTFAFEAEFGLAEEARISVAGVPDKPHGLDILVVDDDVHECEWLEARLVAAGFNVVCVQSGLEAMEALREREFSLIIMDWMMPGMDGIETIRRIHAQRSWTNVPEIIMVTAYAYEDIRRSAEQIGIRHLLLKPIDPSLLIDAVISAIGAERMIEYRQATATIETAEERLRGAHVLLAEDNEINRVLAMELLSGIGISVDVACTGIEVIRQARLKQYDVILMDVEMPEMDGLTAATRIREEEQHRDLPIIAMTANVAEGYRERCLQAGMSDYVSKPINPASLFSVLAKWIPVRAKTDPAGFPVLSSSPMEAAPHELSGIDYKLALSRSNKNIELLDTLLGMFHRLNLDVGRDVADAIQEQRYADAGMLVHRTVGSAGNIAATQLHEAARALERKLRSGSPADCRGELVSFEKELTVVLETTRPWGLAKKT